MQEQAVSRQEILILGALSILTLVAYFCNLGLNNIWTPNESFYAEAIREMFKSGNYLEPFYNYEPRFNKPIMIYWLVLLSTKIFGLTEFAIRLPSALAGLGTILLVYRIGRMLDGQKLAIIAAMVMAFSFQFAINARYAAPAIPLTFFYTLTIYWFLVGYHKEKFSFILLAYIALGITILTKGYPYLIIIGAIIVFYILLDRKWEWKSFFKKLGFLRLYIGIPLALLIGMSWIIYMYIAYGQEFHEIFMMETFERAFTWENSGLKPFFYLEANIWGFLPYSLSFYIGVIYLLVKKFRGFWESHSLMLGTAWFLVMLVVFTASRGKIPTYFIQGYPGMSLFTAWFLVHRFEFHKAWYKAFQVGLWVPGVLFTIGAIAIPFIFPTNYLVLMISFLPMFGIVLGYYKDWYWIKVISFPFTAFACMYIVFSLVVFPFVEKGYRNQDKIGTAILEQVPDTDIPLMAEDFKTWNLPFYARRKSLDNLSTQQIQDHPNEQPLLALVRKDNLSQYDYEKVLWEGLIYTGSETRTLELIIDVLKAERGESTRFKTFCVIYRPGESSR